MANKKKAKPAPDPVTIVRDAVLDALTGANVQDGFDTLTHIEDAQPEERGKDEITFRFGALGSGPGDHPLAGKHFRVRVEEITDSIDTKA